MQQHIRQVLPQAEAAITANSYSPDYAPDVKPQPEPQNSPCKAPRRAARHSSMAAWFWWLVEEMAKLRSCHVSEGHSREEHILRQLEARKFTAAQAAPAEHHILYGNWRSEKTLRIGLELSDFYPDAITVTKQEFEVMRQHMYYALRSQVREELQQATVAPERTEQEQSIIEEYQKAIASMHIAMQKDSEKATRESDRAKELAKELYRANGRITRQQARLVVVSDELSELGRHLAELQQHNFALQSENAELRSFASIENSSENGEFWEIFEDEPDCGEPYPPSDSLHMQSRVERW